MPEGPETQSIADDLNSIIRGRQILSCETNVVKPEWTTRALTGSLDTIVGKTVNEVTSRGKYVIIKLSDPIRVIYHPSSGGQVLLEDMPRRDDTSLVATIKFAGGDAGCLHFRSLRGFSHLWVAGIGEVVKEVDTNLGPEAMNVSLEDFTTGINKSGKKLKDILIDQHFVAGIGDIYGDEIPAKAGVLPYRKGNTITKEESTALFEAMRTILPLARSLGGSSIYTHVTIRGNKGQYRNRHIVFLLKKCSVCEGEVSTMIIGGRKSYFCLNCQK